MKQQQISTRVAIKLISQTMVRDVGEFNRYLELDLQDKTYKLQWSENARFVIIEQLDDAERQTSQRDSDEKHRYERKIVHRDRTIEALREQIQALASHASRTELCLERASMILERRTPRGTPEL